jgi:hypothetical protein
MRKSPMLQFALVVSAAILSHVAPALAQSGTYGITWVASNGTSNATCQRANPCANFDQALAAVVPGGTIMCADNGPFTGATAITHSLTIDCIGTTAWVGQVVIQASPGDVVTLKGLLVDGNNANGVGSANGLIKFTGAGTLQLQDMKIANILGSVWSGVLFQPAGTAKLTITNCDITNVGSGGITAGVTIRPVTGVQATFAIEKSRINNNYFGIILVGDSTAGSAIRGVVHDSVASGNTNNGITVSGAGTNVTLTVDNTIVSGNNFGLVASGTNAGMLIRRSVVNSNVTGLSTSGGGVLFSYRDNSVNGNTTTDGVFTGFVGLQ